MIALRNNLIFGIVKKIILVIFTVIYKILALFNLQLTLLLSLVGLILFLTGAFDVKAVLVVFYVLIIFSIVLAVITTIKKVLGIGNKPKKSKGAQIIDTDKDRIDDEVYGLIEDLIADVEHMVYDAIEEEESRIEEDQWRTW